MTVKELIEELKNYNEDWTVLHYDEGCCGYMKVNEVFMNTQNKTIELE